MKIQIIALVMISSLNFFQPSFAMEETEDIVEENCPLAKLPTESILHILKFSIEPNSDALDGLDIFGAIDKIKYIVPLKNILLTCKSFYSFKPELIKQIRRMLVQKFASEYLQFSKEELNQLFIKGFDDNENFNEKREIDAAKLIIAGADADLIINRNVSMSMLHHIVCYGTYVKLIPVLLLSGADINFRTNSNSTPLICAVNYNHENIMKILIENGADINAQSANGNTALMHAARHGLISSLRLLLENHANPNIQNLEGETALVFASTKGLLAVVEMLLEYKADPKVQNCTENTPFSLTLRYPNREQIIKLLMTYDNSIDLEKIDCWRSKYSYKQLKELMDSIKK